MENFQYVIAIHFQATCNEIQPRIKFRKSEIIEFPAVLLDLKTGQIVAEFHEYVKPVEKPLLSDFCKNLTGITQESVDQGMILQEVLSKFESWLKNIILQYNLIFPKTPEANRIGKYNCAFVCWNHCDLQIFLTSECHRKSIQKAPYFNQWISLQKLFSNNFQKKGFQNILREAGLEISDKQRSGIDDSKNIALLLRRQAGEKIEITNDMTPKIKEIII